MTMTKAATRKIRTLEDLRDVMAGLPKGEWLGDYAAEHGLSTLDYGWRIDRAKLPKFGGSKPVAAASVMSWDPDRLLLHSLLIVPRDALDRTFTVGRILTDHPGSNTRELVCNDCDEFVDYVESNLGPGYDGMSDLSLEDIERRWGDQAFSLACIHAVEHAHRMERST